MKDILRRLIKTHRDNRGLTFVEVICAVAILALVTGVIGSVIVISSRTYRKGISETSIQQEAQLAANNIGNIIKDACGVIYGESGEQYIENGDTPMVNASDSTPKMQAVGYTELSVITNDKIQYTMTYDMDKKTLLYQEYDVETGAARTNAEVMAQNVKAFQADTTDFKDSKAIKLKMTVEDSSTGREIPMEYTMTSRNGAGEGGEYVTATDNVVIIFLEDDVVMVPGETYEIPISVSGKLSAGALEWGSVTGLTEGELTLNHAQVTVPVGTTDRTASFSIHTKDKEENGTPKAEASCTVNIRRVEEVKVSHSIDRSKSEGGMLETKGTVYTFSAAVSGNELAKKVAYAYDSNYKTAQSVVWSWELVADGVTSTREWTCAQNGDGTYEFTFTDTNKDKFDEYISITTNKEDALLPQLVLKIEKNMPADFALTVRAASKHALGVNKAASQYYVCDKSESLADTWKGAYWNDDFTKPRETVVNSGLEITLEPWETGEVPLGMKGGLTSDVTFEYNDRSDNDTKAEYLASTDKVSITLGKDEKGTGNTPEAGKQKYTFTIDVKVGGVKKSTITVHVCRIDVMSIEVIDNFTDKDGKLMNLPTYDFRGRINVSNGKIDNSVTEWLFDDKDAVPNTLASRITWEWIEGSKVIQEDSVICLAGKSASDKGSIIGSYAEKKDKYYKIVHIKPARIEQDDTGAWYLKQMPEIDIAPLADTATGLPANTRLKVTMEMLHPLGTVEGTKYNKTGKAYGEAKASVIIEGTQTISVPKDIIYVEPGQGTSDVAQSDEELVIPITVSGGAVYKMEVLFDGKSETSKGTKLSGYSSGNDSYGNSNPYMASTATSSGTRTWYMGLLIGKDETGNDDGLIDVTINAKSTNGKDIIASTTFQLALRRVNEVSVKVKDGKAFKDLNEAGGTVTLEAYPKGYGSDSGTEYFAEQKDENGNVCRWEQANHGEYKSPYPMKWKMYYGGVEKELSAWTEYFADVSSSTNADKHKATVTFKLLQELPSGAKLRAYSLHAQGKEGDTKYNKSGKEYDEVYGELAVGTGSWKRGGTVNITDWLPQEVFYTDEEGRTGWANSDGTGINYDITVNLITNFYSKYIQQSTGNNLAWTSTFNISLWYSSIGGERAFSKINVTNNDVSTATATLSTEEDWLRKSSYSSAYPMDDSVWWIDMDKIHLETTINGTKYEQDYDIEDVVFQYRNSLPDVSTSKKNGDSDGAWTKKSSNTLVVYVTPDDTISTYDSYYKLSEGWEETYEQYACLPERYVGVVSSSERMTDFTVTNTTGTGSSLGRSYVSFAFDKNIRSNYVGKTVQMIYEYNPYFCNPYGNAVGWRPYDGYNAEELAAADGCEGILEFHFVNANIDSSVTGPQVRYCPTYAENGGEYYYISKNARFKLSSDGTTAYYQTATCTDTTSSLTSSSWNTVCTMTYNNGTWK